MYDFPCLWAFEGKIVVTLRNVSKLVLVKLNHLENPFTNMIISSTIINDIKILNFPYSYI